MPALSGSQKALMYAQAGVMRAGASRAGYHSPQVFVAVNGAQIATARATDANKALNGTLVISEVLNDVPNTASFTTKGIEPTEGQDVIVTLGSIHNYQREFGGTILNRTHRYVGTPANFDVDLNAIDYTWQLTWRRISGMWTNVSATVIGNAIVSAAPAGFTSGIAAGLPTVDAFSVTDVTLLQALATLAKRIGGYCDVDYRKVVKLFITDSSVTNPVALTSAHVSLTEFAVTYDLGSVITRVLVEGGGVTALAPCAVGETIIPVDTAAWYNPAGGTVKSGPQHVTYTGVQAGGAGALVGPGAAPSSAPGVTTVAGTGLGAGTYQYAYTDVTGAGESLPSPLGTVVTGAIADPGVAPVVAYNGPNAINSGAFRTIGETVGYKYAYSADAGAGTHVLETLPSPEVTTTTTQTSDPLNPTHSSVIGVTLPYSTDPRVKWIVIYSRATSVGGTYYYTDYVANNPAGGSVTWQNTGGDMNAGANPLGANGAVYQQTALAGIAVGPTGTTSRKVYRTAVNGSQLKLHSTIANNTTTTIATDATVDGSLGANAPTSDNSGLTQPSGTVNAGSTSLLLAGAGAFAAAGGWARIGSGAQIVRYTGITGNSLTGIPASGSGSISASISYNTTATASPALTGVPASGPGSIVYPIQQGDQVNLLVQVDDAAAQTALATLVGGGSDGIVRDDLQDGRLGETEARALGTAQLALKSLTRVSIAYKVRDKNTHAGRIVSVSLGAPTSVTRDFQIQRVTIDAFWPALMPTYTVQASSDLFSLEDLLRVARKAA